VVRVGRKTLNRPALVVLAVAAFLALTFFGIPFPIVVLLAGAAGWALGRWRPDIVRSAEAKPDGPEPVIPDDVLHTELPSAGRTARVIIIGLLLWGLPILAAALLTGTDSVFTQMGLFFSGTAVVTFGGAYAVLAYVAQRAVEVYGWLTPIDMVRGLALAETTPGPLIMVVQFVAFIGAYNNPGDLNPWAAAVLASLLVTWVTFVPCFLFVFFGAPYMEKLRGNRALSSALTGVTAAVVGVIASLGVYFALHTLFTGTASWTWGPLTVQIPVMNTFQPFALVLAVLAWLLLTRSKINVLATLGICATLGLTAGLTGLLPVG
jgi:chromate transporter